MTEPPPSSGAQSERYRSYALGLLLVVYVFNFIDRQILTILLEPIKQDLELSDTALGFLTGFAFAFFYTFAGIPIARWADSGSRTTIIALGLFLWSAATALTGFARGFVHLAAARVGVGLGEAACSPPAHSLISDYFPPERRATALGIYALGIPIGGAIGTLAGGWINELFDWRTAFLVVGLPGVALALVTRLTLREPPRGRFDAPAAAGAQRESIREVFAFLWGLRSFRHMSFAAALHAFVGYGAAAFAPSFLIRIHDFSTGELSTWLAGIAITFGSLGTYLGGSFTDGLAQRDVRNYLRVPAWATVAYIPFALLFYLWPDGRQAMLAYTATAMLGLMYLGPTFALTQNLAKPSMRALASSILLFIINLIGLGAGPQFVGLLSDQLTPQYGTESIRWALLSTVSIGSAWSAAHYFLASRTLEADLRAKDG